MRPVVAALVLAPLALAGCGYSCNLMYSPSRVTLELVGDAWAPGLYEVELSGSGETAMCVVTLPSVEGDLVSCTDNAQIELDPTGARILSFAAIEFAPDSFQATILLDGEILAQEHFTPAYDVFEPNGPGCGETSVATLAMAIVRLALATLALALGGCRVCHQMRAPSELVLELDGGAWPAGLYEVELEGFGQRALCVLELPHAEADPVSCTDNATLELDAGGERIVALRVLEFDPPSFDAWVLRDGELAGEEHFVPDYVVDEPNGNGCGERSRATVAMSIDP